MNTFLLYPCNHLVQHKCIFNISTAFSVCFLNCAQTIALTPRPEYQEYTAEQFSYVAFYHLSRLLSSASTKPGCVATVGSF